MQILTLIILETLSRIALDVFYYYNDNFLSYIFAFEEKKIQIIYLHSLCYVTFLMFISGLNKV